MKLTLSALIFALSAPLFFSFSAQAQDSTWLTCSNDAIFLNVYEHRGTGVDERDTDLTLIYGEHDLKTIMSSNDPSVTPDAKGYSEVYINALGKEDQEFFTGKIKIDYDKPSVALNGRLFLDGSKIPFKINTTLKCKEMKRLQ